MKRLTLVVNNGPIDIVAIRARRAKIRRLRLFGMLSNNGGAA